MGIQKIDLRNDGDAKNRMSRAAKFCSTNECHYNNGGCHTNAAGINMNVQFVCVQLATFLTTMAKRAYQQMLPARSHLKWNQTTKHGCLKWNSGTTSRSNCQL